MPITAFNSFTDGLDSNRRSREHFISNINVEDDLLWVPYAVLGELAHGRDVAALGPCGETPQLHILHHSLAEWRHHDLLSREGQALWRGIVRRPSSQ